MAEIQTLTDADFQSVLNQRKPVLLLVTTGDDLRGDFSTAFKKAVDEHPDVTIARLDAQKNPQAADLLQIGRRSVLIAYFDGEEVVRRPRPWGTDVPLAIEMLEDAVQSAAPAVPEPAIIEDQTNGVTDQMTLDNSKPVTVTDDTFQQEVIDYELPVLVDFWAEWCGPCRMVSPILEKLAGEYAGQIRVAKVNVDENPGLAQAFQVMSIPTIMAIKDQTIVFSQPGALPEPAFRQLIDQLIALDMSQVETEEQNETQN
jgi:thioredoxin 1